MDNRDPCGIHTKAPLPSEISHGGGGSGDAEVSQTERADARKPRPKVKARRWREALARKLRLLGQFHAGSNSHGWCHVEMAKLHPVRCEHRAVGVAIIVGQQDCAVPVSRVRDKSGRCQDPNRVLPFILSGGGGALPSLILSEKVWPTPASPSRVREPGSPSVASRATSGRQCRRSVRGRQIRPARGRSPFCRNRAPWHFRLIGQ